MSKEASFNQKYIKAVLAAPSAKEGGLSPHQAILAIAWADICDYDTGENVRQSFNTVAKKAKMDRTSAIRLTNGYTDPKDVYHPGLVDLGWLTVVKREDFKPTEFALAIPATSSTEQPPSSTEPLPSRSVPLETSSSVHKTSSTVQLNKKNTTTTNKNKDKNSQEQAVVADAPPAPPLVPLTKDVPASPLPNQTPLAQKIQEVRDASERVRRILDEADDPAGAWLLYNHEVWHHVTARDRRETAEERARSASYCSDSAQEILERLGKSEGSESTPEPSEARTENPEPSDDPLAHVPEDAEW